MTIVTSIKDYIDHEE